MFFVNSMFLLSKNYQSWTIYMASLHIKHSISQSVTNAVLLVVCGFFFTVCLSSFNRAKYNFNLEKELFSKTIMRANFFSFHKSV